ncbi:Endonuclease III [Chromobacterium violaceum]|uniref:Endonuclease III n=1 Tax=Chromobacterium violaceum TaxID=536 RepID=A0A447THS2_CHRVL|nr:Endonuclease III [Chromobacterium violaceum]
MNAAKRQEIFRRLRDDNPHPTTELEYNTPFELLISVLLSAQATDVGVNKATRRLYPVANTPAAMLALGEEGLAEYIKTIGLYKTKARNVIATCRLLLEKHGGEVPQTREALEALPASAARPPTWCSTPPSVSPPSRWTPTSSACPTAPASRRQGCARGGGQAGAFRAAEFKLDAHHWLILLGATYARPGSRNATAARSRTSANTRQNRYDGNRVEIRYR